MYGGAARPCPLTLRAAFVSSASMTPRRIAIVIFAFCLIGFARSGTAIGMVGGAPPAEPAIARHVAMLIGSRGTACSGVVIAREVVLTAAHCLQEGASYMLVEFDALHKPQLRPVARVATHPQFELNALLAHRATADVGLAKLAAPLSGAFMPAPLAVADRTVAVGDQLLVAGFGVTVRGDGSTGGTARAATLVVTGRPGSLQIRLVDPAGKGERPGVGACTGDSGAPLFEIATSPAVIGVVSWSTGPNLSAGCGGLTGITPLARYRAWIVETAAMMSARS
jgi:hypothetical protein